MEMNFYTKRERAKLSAMLSPGMVIDDTVIIDPLKEEIALTYPEAEWNAKYREVKMVVHAMMELARYNCCKRLQGWVWYVPRTPTKLAFETNPLVKVDIQTVAHPPRYNEYLEVIWNRPRAELAEIIKVIQQVEIPGLNWVSWDTVDANHNFWALSWVAGAYHNHNTVYLNRR